jgi:hypothetical protein
LRVAEAEVQLDFLDQARTADLVATPLSAVQPLAVLVDLGLERSLERGTTQVVSVVQKA